MCDPVGGRRLISRLGAGFVLVWRGEAPAICIAQAIVLGLAIAALNP
ncbi:hypothetical protein EC9_10700 [Rosistilla ulvae]|uniref:Uncharacterized protein n=1 Tax=Rosistilla ulvae TaxID=1930277 RepID=A0A517LWA0_9BACT|nr:hypothetical protein EC9_10700 [Rosistilla ulvae]